VIAMDRRETTALLLMAAFGLALRLAVVFTATPGNALGRLDDDTTYLNLARSILVDHAYVSPPQEGLAYRAFRPPLFPLFAAAVMKVHDDQTVLALRCYLAVLSLLVPLAMWFLARRLWSPREGLVAFGWGVVHPHFVHYAAHVQNDTLFLIFSTWAVAWMMVQRSGGQTFLAGVLTGLACLGRSQFFGAAPIGALWAWLKPGPASRRAWAVLFLTGVVLALAPWWIRNMRVLGKFVPFSTEGGLTLWVGNNPLADGGGDCPVSPVPRELNEIDRDRWHYREALRFMRENPGRTAELAGSKLARFWSPVPRAGGAATKLISLASFGAMYVFFLAGLWFERRRLREWTPLLLLCLYYTATQTVFPTLMRYRLVLEPFFLTLGAAALVRLWERRPPARGAVP